MKSGVRILGSTSTFFKLWMGNTLVRIMQGLWQRASWQRELASDPSHEPELKGERSFWTLEFGIWNWKLRWAQANR